ncbi:MAG: hypothetical protein U0Q14_01420 [Dermatophilaceae bacterium]
MYEDVDAGHRLVPAGIGEQVERDELEAGVGEEVSDLLSSPLGSHGGLDGMPLLEQLADDVLGDEARRSGDQDGGHGVSSEGEAGAAGAGQDRRRRRRDRPDMAYAGEDMEPRRDGWTPPDSAQAEPTASDPIPHGPA